MDTDEIISKWSDGKSVSEIAREHAVSEKQVIACVSDFVGTSLQAVETEPDSIYIFSLVNLKRLVDELWGLFEENPDRAENIASQIREVIKLMINASNERSKLRKDTPHEVEVVW